jgi:FG-GAP-like repeat/Glycosyl hydrolase catalytic core
LREATLAPQELRKLSLVAENAPPAAHLLAQTRPVPGRVTMKHFGIALWLTNAALFAGCIAPTATGVEPADEVGATAQTVSGPAPSVSATAERKDPRFRLYGEKMPQGPTITNTTLPHRMGGGSAAACADDNHPKCDFDFITLGALDGNPHGPYAGAEDSSISTKFMFLRESPPATRYDCGLNVTNWSKPSRCIAQAGSDKYEELIQQWPFEAKKSLAYKTQVLQRQFDLEKQIIPKLIANWKASHPSGDPLVIEIGNEPNIYPSMEPTTYAWYFDMWRKEVRARLAEVQDPPPVKFMSGGLWIFEGYPLAMQKAVRQGAQFAIGRIPLLKYPSGVHACGSFWNPLDPPRLCVDWTTVDLTPGIDIRFKGYADTLGYFNSFANALKDGPVDIANLHLYPYVANYAQWGAGNVAKHVDNLNAFAEKIGPKATSGEVWITELGNFNPFGDEHANRKLVRPLLSELRSRASSRITRWYWYLDKSDDPKLDAMGGAGYKGALGWNIIYSIAHIHSPIVTVEKPELTDPEHIVMTQLATWYTSEKPAQGLLDKYGNLRRIGLTYMQFACPACAKNYGSFNGNRSADLAFATTKQIWVNTSTGSGLWGSGTGLWSDFYQFGGSNYFNYLPGDFNGDGLLDLGHVGPTHAVAITVGTGSGFFGAGSGTWVATKTFGDGEGKYLVGDFNGDGKDDLLFFSGADNSLWVRQSNGTGFASKQRWDTDGYGSMAGRHYVGDFNGDGLSDVGYFETDRTFHVLLSTGTAFGAAGSGQWIGQDNFGHMLGQHYVGDFDADGYTDLAFHEPGDQTIHVETSTGSGFQYRGVWLKDSRFTRSTSFYPADYNGDGRVDFGYSSVSDGFFAVYSTGASFVPQGNGQWLKYKEYGDLSSGRYYTAPTR